MADDPRTLEDAFLAHEHAASGAVSGGDPRAIKQMYVDLAEDLAAAVGEGDAPGLAFPETADAVARILADGQGLHLDAGCGPNPVASFRVAELSGRPVVGVDIGHGMVALARRMAARRDVEFLGVVADLERLPFRDGAFGSVVCDDTIEHLPDDAAGFRELARTAVPDARLVLATPNRRRLDVVVAKLRDRARGRRRPASDYYEVASHLREYTHHELVDVAAPWLEAVGRGHVPWTGSRIRRVASWVTRLPGLWRLGRVVLVVFRRR